MKSMTNNEQIVSNCARLYSGYGYRRFIMNKFESYSLYADNKSFLVDDRLLTFTDGGQLKALKPDITLSIVKNLAKQNHFPLKVYYDEAVYRVKKGDREFSELRQMGLELIGDDSLYATAEVICLAKASLDIIHQDSILDISHMGILLPLIDNACRAGMDRQEIMDLISQKNADGLETILIKFGCPDTLAKLVKAYAPISDMILELNMLFPDSEPVRQITEIAEILREMNLDKNVYLDFSLMHDFSYYNGIIFKGYVKNVPVAVLSGGRYDPLLERFGLNSAAIGFAIYMDYIQYHDESYEDDVLLLYSQDDDACAVARAMQILINQGYCALAATQPPANRSFTKTITVKEVLS